jgi:hypothetical protein
VQIVLGQALLLGEHLFASLALEFIGWHGLSPGVEWSLTKTGNKRRNNLARKYLTQPLSFSRNNMDGSSGSCWCIEMNFHQVF